MRPAQGAAGSVFQKSMPPACWPTSIVATVRRVARSMISTVPGSAPTPSTVTKAYRSSGEMTTPLATLRRVGIRASSLLVRRSTTETDWPRFGAHAHHVRRAARPPDGVARPVVHLREWERREPELLASHEPLHRRRISTRDDDVDRHLADRARYQCSRRVDRAFALPATRDEADDRVLDPPAAGVERLGSEPNRVTRSDLGRRRRHHDAGDGRLGHVRWWRSRLRLKGGEHRNGKKIRHVRGD